MLLQFLSIFLLYAGMTLGLRFFISSIAGSSFLSFGSKIFFSAFLPIVLFLSLILLIMPDPGLGTLLFILLLMGSRVIILLTDGNLYLQGIILHDKQVEIAYVTDFLQQKKFTIQLNEIRSVKLDDARRLTDYPCRLQIFFRRGRKLKFLIIDQEQLKIHENDILEMLNRLGFRER